MSEPAAVRFAKDHLKAFVERIERLEEEKKAIADDIKDVYAEAKANGFDVKAIRACVKLRKIEAAERAEQLAILETYMHALGMLDDVPGAGMAAKTADLAAQAKELGDRMAGRPSQARSDDDVTITTAARTRTIKASEIGPEVRKVVEEKLGRTQACAARAQRITSDSTAAAMPSAASGHGGTEGAGERPRPQASRAGPPIKARPP